MGCHNRPDRVTAGDQNIASEIWLVYLFIECCLFVLSLFPIFAFTTRNGAQASVCFAVSLVSSRRVPARQHQQRDTTLARTAEDNKVDGRDGACHERRRARVEVVGCSWLCVVVPKRTLNNAFAHADCGRPCGGTRVRMYPPTHPFVLFFNVADTNDMSCVQSHAQSSR